MNWHSLLLMLAVPAVCFSARGDEATDRTAFEAARQLEREGKVHEAFERFLAIPGGEFSAQSIARADPEDFLRVIHANPQTRQSPRARLVEADLLLAIGRRTDAARLYVELASADATNRWGTDREDYYPVEVPDPSRDGRVSEFAFGPLEPFVYGPGSHRDNWLLRRLIALDKLDDAAREFARLWAVHRSATRPWIEMAHVWHSGAAAGETVRVRVRPQGLDAAGLEFALDYAFFLKQRGDTNGALAVLSEPLRLLDMDRDPNIPERETLTNAPPDELPLRPANWRHSVRWIATVVGVSRKDFIRLTYGEFKAAGREAELIGNLEQRITAGDNRARRVLAQVRIHQGQNDAALALELEYLRVGDFDERTKLYRRGQVLEEFHKPAKAIAEFEKLLAESLGPVRPPDPEEQIAENARLTAAAAPDPGGRLRSMTNWWRADVQARLLRLYAATGQTDKALDLELARFSESEDLLRDPAGLENMATRFRSAQQEPRFTDWARRRLDQSKSPVARANLTWVLKDYPVAARTVALVATNGNSYELQSWKDRFRNLGRDNFRELLAAIVAANPRDTISRLEMLDLDDRLEGPEAIEAIEALLAADASPAFPLGKGGWNRTHFSSYFDLAYRLMRLYEKNHQSSKLQALALRIARGDKPFDDRARNQYIPPWNTGVAEHANAALALAIQHADTAREQNDLAAALTNSPWTGARAQLERRRHPDSAGRLQPKTAAWIGVVEGVELFASLENVLSLARNDEFIFAGHPWGVAVYDFQGNLIARVALGEAVRALAADEHAAWAGTPKGLFRIQRTRAGWSVAHQPLDGDVPPQNRYGRSFPGPNNYWFDNGVYALAMDKEQLWIGLHRNVQRLNTRTLDLRAFSFAELKISSWGGFNRFVVEEDCVWTDSPHAGLRRYDRRTDTWDAPVPPARGHSVSLIGVIDGQVWGHAWVNDTLRDRPCLIDRQTLKVTPVPNAGRLTRDQQMINGPFRWLGRHEGRLVFGDGNFAFEYDPAARKLALIDARPDGSPLAFDDAPSDTLRLPDGTRVFGRSIPGGAEYDYPFRDASLTSNVEEGAGGLFFVASTGVTNRVSSVPWTGALPGDNVFKIVFDDDGDWLCTSRGVVRMGARGEVAARFTRAEGLLANLVQDGAKLGGKVYFASGWGDSAGGLIVFDPVTRVFTSFFRSDGMDADKLEALTVVSNQLGIAYGIDRVGVWQPGEKDFRRSPAGTFDPRTGRFTSGGPPTLMTLAEVQSQPAQPREPMPFLGGWLIRRLERDGTNFLCGTRGMVVMRGAIAPPAFAALGAHVITDPREQLLAEARQFSITKPIPVGELRSLLAHTNGYVRANALVAAMQPVLRGDSEYFPVIALAVDDPLLNVRSTAVWLLSRSVTNGETSRALKQALKDPDPGIRAVAALALANRGDLPPLSYFEEIIREEYSFGNYPFGADSSVGVEVDAEKTFAALAPYADDTIFSLLLEHPLAPDTYEPRAKVFAAFGESLRRRPGGADVLLKAHGRDERSGWPREAIAQAIFKYAGKDLLPVLHRALSSTNRVVCSNAARACGAIGDPSSIPFLLGGLDMESGLARASIVWALGELKAREALPKLFQLYTDTRNDEQNRRGGAGFLAQQAMAANRGQYRALRNLDAIAGEWDELRLTTPSRRSDPDAEQDFRSDEDLLSARHVLEAVGKIGPAASQSFYRGLAGASDAGDRREAAAALAASGPEDLATNLDILRNLRNDADGQVRIAALISLLVLGEPRIEPVVHELFAAPDNSSRAWLLEQLARLPAKQQSLFRNELEKIAGNDLEPPFVRSKAQSLMTKF